MNIIFTRNILQTMYYRGKLLISASVSLILITKENSVSTSWEKSDFSSIHKSFRNIGPQSQERMNNHQKYSHPNFGGSGSILKNRGFQKFLPKGEWQKFLVAVTGGRNLESSPKFVCVWYTIVMSCLTAIGVIASRLRHKRPLICNWIGEIVPNYRNRLGSLCNEIVEFTKSIHKPRP